MDAAVGCVAVLVEVLVGYRSDRSFVGGGSENGTAALEDIGMFIGVEHSTFVDSVLIAVGTGTGMVVTLRIFDNVPRGSNILLMIFLVIKNAAVVVRTVAPIINGWLIERSSFSTLMDTMVELNDAEN